MRLPAVPLALALLAGGCHKAPECGACPTGSACGSANGLPVCRAASAIPRFQHVFVIVMENTSLKTLQQSSAAPYLDSLFSSAASSSNYHGDSHPSLPNYLAMTSGLTGGVECDCAPVAGAACEAGNCNLLTGSCGCPQTAQNLADELESAALGWRAYGEDMGTPCNLADSGNYATRHVPFLYYTDIQSDMSRCAAHVVDYAANFASDLAGPLPAYTFIAPNLIDDMHSPVPATDTNYANGDMWLSQQIPKILQSSAYKNGGILFIVWDEDDLSGLVDADDPIPLIVLSPYAKSGGFVSAVAADHFALLATIEDGLGIPRLGESAQAATLADFFPAQ